MSFAVLLFFLLQLGTGMLLTLFYTPEITSTEAVMYSEVEFGNVSPPYLVGTLFLATIVFFLSQIFISHKNASI